MNPRMGTNSGSGRPVTRTFSWSVAAPVDGTTAGSLPRAIRKELSFSSFQVVGHFEHLWSVTALVLVV